MNKERSKAFASAVRSVVENEQGFFNKNGGLNASAIANYTGVPQPTVYRNLTGKTNPSESTIEKFAQAFNQTPALFRGEISTTTGIKEDTPYYASPDILTLIDHYQNLPPSGKRLIINLVTTLHDMQNCNPALQALLKQHADYDLERLLTSAIATVFARKS